MSKNYFTIGMAGHIDHGKTTLTKALTEINTDRLKEEQERQISIELGFAPLYEDEEIQISVIDVPGHERFVRQMIAGVTGIDLVVLVVAADEGVMPQTREHLDILSFLGIENGIVAISKTDRVEEDFVELVKDDIYESLQGTVFEEAPYVLVDSLSKLGISELKALIIDTLKSKTMRDAKGAFRLPIDQVFTVKGQGTVVRGTVYEGSVFEGDSLTVLPEGREVRARQLQVHRQQAESAFAGQRVAINLSGLTKSDIQRGDVLVSSDHFIVTDTIDVALRIVGDLDYIVKQRMPIKCHIGTAEVMGRIVFFDRNEIKDNEGEILCQLRLEHDIVTKRGDRFIIRRPSPQETIGGGWVIDARGDKYRFGEKTIDQLEKKKVGSPIERITDSLIKEKSLTLKELIKQTALDEETLRDHLEQDEFLLYSNKDYSLKSIVSAVEEDLADQLLNYHDQHPLRQGMNKQELFHQFPEYPNQLLEFTLADGITREVFDRKGQYLSHESFQPSVPSNWQKRTESMLASLQTDASQVKYLANYIEDAGIAEDVVADLIGFLESDGQIIALDQDFYWHFSVYEDNLQKLKAALSSEFTIAEARDATGLTRKYLIPFLELLDKQKITVRVENKRRFLN